MARWLALIVHHYAPKVIKPGNGALHDLAPGDWHEAARSGWGPARHLVLPAQGLHLLGKSSLVGLIHQHAKNQALVTTFFRMSRSCSSRLNFGTQTLNLFALDIARHGLGQCPALPAAQQSV